MINTIFLFWGMLPVAVGLGFIFRPRKMVRMQTRFRKRMERMEKRFYKAHRATGLGLVLAGLVLLLTYFHPVWIYNMFLVARVVIGLFFPHLFEPTVVQAVRTVYL